MPAMVAAAPIVFAKNIRRPDIADSSFWFWEACKAVDASRDVEIKGVRILADLPFWMSWEKACTLDKHKTKRIRSIENR